MLVVNVCMVPSVWFSITLVDSTPGVIQGYHPGLSPTGQSVCFWVITFWVVPLVYFWVITFWAVHLVYFWVITFWTVPKIP